MFAAAKNLGDGTGGMGDLLARLRVREKARHRKQVYYTVCANSRSLARTSEPAYLFVLSASTTAVLDFSERTTGVRALDSSIGISSYMKDKDNTLIPNAFAKVVLYGT